MLLHRTTIGEVARIVHRSTRTVWRVKEGLAREGLVRVRKYRRQFCLPFGNRNTSAFRNDRAPALQPQGVSRG
jgi:hypothetical protein